MTIKLSLSTYWGSGKSLNPKKQGAHVIQQVKNALIRKNTWWPTREEQLLTDTSLSVEFADRYTSKDISVDSWCELLDDAISDVANPVRVWAKFRHRLLDQGVTPLQLAKLEDAYVGSFLSDPSKNSSSQCSLRPKSLTSLPISEISLFLLLLVLFLRPLLGKDGRNR